MTPKQTALIQVAKLVIVAVLVGVVTSLAFSYFTIGQIGVAFSIVVMACLVKMVYDLEVAKAEHIEALNKMK